MKDIVFLVSAEQGQWSDRTNWIEAIYSSKEQAELHCKIKREEEIKTLKECYEEYIERTGRNYTFEEFYEDKCATYEVLEQEIFAHYDQYIDSCEDKRLYTQE